MVAVCVAAVSAGVAAGNGSTVRGGVLRRNGGLDVARFGEPQGGRLLLGVVCPDPVGFDRLTGKHHALHVMFANWAGDVAGLIAREHDAGRLPVLSLPSGASPAEIASGVEDARYVTLAQAVNGSGERHPSSSGPSGGSR
jgi:hypothetical protein